MAEEEWNDQIALPWNVPIFMRNIINNVDCLNSCDFFFRNIQLLHAKKKCNVLEIFLYVCILEIHLHHLDKYWTSDRDI